MAASWRNRILRLPGPQHVKRWSRGALQRIVIGAALVTLTGLFTWASPLATWLEEFNYDLSLLFPAPAPDDALIVLMDEQAYRNRGQDPKRGWDRSLHAKLLDIVFARGARAVVFDVLFSEPSPDRDVDAALARAMSVQNRKVIQAAKVNRSEINKEVVTDVTLEPIEPFLSAAPYGIVDLPSSPDLALRVHSDRPNSLARKTAEVLGRSVQGSARARWIRYYSGSLNWLGYDRALQPEDLSPAVFSNKVVFVGQGRITTTEGSNTDLYRTSRTRWTGRRSPGVEIQATAFLNLWRHEWIERLASPLEAGVFSISGVLLGIALPLFRPRTASFLAILVALAVIVVASLALWQANLWFPWLILAGVQVPCALAWSLFSYRDRRTLQPTPAVKIPDHTLLRRVGRGGYGEVWLAQDIIRTYHAVKLVYRGDFDGSAPFDREFRGIQKFTPISHSHPGFVHIFHVGKADSDEYFFYVMEAADDIVTGQRIDPKTYTPRTLARDILGQRRVPVRDCIELGIALAAALNHLHQHQLIHRDIKPSNIIFVDNAPKFADIGLVTDVAAKTGDVSKVGTEGYIAPEGPGTPAADVFSLGMVLYEAGMGLDPQQFPELTTALQTEPEDPGLRELHNIIVTACETDPQHRYRSAMELCNALAQLRDCMKARPSI